VAQPGTLPRRVLFYEVRRDNHPVRNRRDFDFAEVFGGIGRLPNTLEGRRDRESDEAYISCIVDSANTVRFGRIRRRGLPSRIDDSDHIDNIPLARNGGLFEATHVMYFEPGIIGAEFNFYAPRVSRLGPYIRRKAGVGGIEIVPIIKGDAARDLRRMDRLKKFTMKVAVDAFDGLTERRGFPIFRRIARAAEAPGVETVDVTLSAEQGRNARSLGQSIVDEILGLAAMPRIREVAERAVAEGYRPDATRLEAVDLLDDELVGTRDFIQENLQTHTLDTRHAYETIASVYRDLEPQRYVRRR
jgi:hypothetical protein